MKFSYRLFREARKMNISLRLRFGSNLEFANSGCWQPWMSIYLCGERSKQFVVCTTPMFISTFVPYSVGARYGYVCNKHSRVSVAQNNSFFPTLKLFPAEGPSFTLRLLNKSVRWTADEENCLCIWKAAENMSNKYSWTAEKGLGREPN